MGAKLDIRRAGGLTMVELVVVVAIIAIMAAVAIPSFARMGLLWRNDLQASARELYTLLRAARIYASTYNVETAVVYTTYRPEGGASANLRAAALMYLDTSNKTFMSVSRRDEGAFRPLPGETCLFEPVSGSESVKAIPQYETVPDDFQAHVFEPSGRLRVSGQQKELFTISVGYGDGASLDERYVDPGDPNSPLRTININLYRTTGRVEIASD